MVFCLSKEDEAVGVVRLLYSKCKKECTYCIESMQIYKQKFILRILNYTKHF